MNLIKNKMLRIPIISVATGIIITVVEWQAWLFWLDDNSIFAHVAFYEFGRKLYFIMVALAIVLFLLMAIFCLRDMTKKEIAKSATIVFAYQLIMISIFSVLISLEFTQLSNFVFNVFANAPYTMFNTLSSIKFLMAVNAQTNIELWAKLSFIQFPNAPVNTSLSTLFLPYLFVFFGKKEKHLEQKS